MKTSVIEELAAEARQSLEDRITKESSVNLPQEGQVSGNFFYTNADEDISFEMTPEEEAELLETFDKAKANFADGKFIALDQFKVKHADKFRGSVQ